LSRTNYLFTSESVSEGHPDKVADRISDTVVDAFLGADPFGTSLDQVLAGHLVGDRAVRVRRLQAIDQPDECQILYAGSSRAQAAAALNKVKGAPVLTVTEQSLGVSGAVVQFYVKDGHVRFTLDPAAAQAHGMTISAKLLALAASIQAGA